MPRKLTDDDERALVKEYRAWDPSDGRSADDIAEQHGVTRQTMYTVLARHGEPLKSHRAPRRSGPSAGLGLPDELVAAMADRALGELIQRLVAAEKRVAELEAELARSTARRTPPGPRSS